MINIEVIYLSLIFLSYCNLKHGFIAKTFALEFSLETVINLVLLYYKLSIT